MTLLIELAREVRGSTLEILRAANETWLTWSPPGTSNHILWHAGHALWLSDLMCVEPISGSSDLPPDWAKLFGMDSRPHRVSKWPAGEEVEELLVRQLVRMVDLLSQVTPERLARPAPGLRGRRSLGGWVIHGLHDEAKHSGEMYLLYKLRSLAPSP